MRRRQLIEIEDLPWCPPGIRDAVTDYLRLLIRVAGPYRPVASRLGHALERCGSQRILDLASGGGGPWPELLDELARRGVRASVVLSDRYPNPGAVQRLTEEPGGRLDYLATPLDAADIPPGLEGFRTIFSSFHHFPPAVARGILQDAVRQRRGIGIFEGTRRHPWVMLLACLNPLAVLLVTPFIRPFRWRRLLWTYLVPAVPVVVLFDGLVSCLRTYTPAELLDMARDLGDPEYLWEAGTVRNRFSLLPVTYLIGCPH